MFGQALRHKTGGFGFDFQWGPCKFSSSPGVRSASKRKSVPRNLLWGKVRPARTADNSAVLVVTNVKIRAEDQHSIHPLGLHDLLGNQEFFVFASFIQNTVDRNSAISCQVRRRLLPLFTVESLSRPGRKQANVSLRMAWISFGALPCRKKKT